MGAKIDKIQGRAKQIEGKLTNDKLRMAQGTVQRKKGDVEGAFARVGRSVKRGVRRAQAELRGARRTRER